MQESVYPYIGKSFTGVHEVKVLNAGFFVGEFGWLLMRWQGVCRYLSRQYDKTVIGCEAEYTYLFEDFANEFIYYTGKPKTRNMWLADQKTYPLTGLVPSKEVCLGNSKQEFVRYGRFDLTKKYDLLFHARSTSNMGTGYRNWPIEKWNQLRKEFPSLKIASTGSVTGANYVQGTDNLIGMPLNRLADYVASAELVISPSSGMGHFASLCCTTHVVWSDERDRGVMNNKERYLKEWNPFKTRCHFISKWQPEINEVKDMINVALSDCNDNL